MTHPLGRGLISGRWFRVSHLNFPVYAAPLFPRQLLI
ncbi:hypothetical protein LINGRAHAP2_LOCUS6425 [Linum grandiflorum]